MKGYYGLPRPATFEEQIIASVASISVGLLLLVL